MRGFRTLPLFLHGWGIQIGYPAAGPVVEKEIREIGRKKTRAAKPDFMRVPPSNKL